MIPKVTIDSSKKKDNRIVFSLVSQSKHHIAIEIIKDMNAMDSHEDEFIKRSSTQ
jgi:hypothetical protein